LLVIDVQERLRGHIDGFDAVAGNVGVLVQAARYLGIPVVVTEQHPVRLGPTATEVARHLDASTVITKTTFSAVRADRFDLAGRDQVLVCGLEAHLCVSQTVHDLIARDVMVQLAADAVASRVGWQRQLGLARAQASGAGITSCEAALFEVMERGATDEFRFILPLLKLVRPDTVEAMPGVFTPQLSGGGEGKRRRQRVALAPRLPVPGPIQHTEKGAEVESLSTVAHPTDPDARFVVHVNGDRTQWYEVEDDRHTPLPRIDDSAVTSDPAGSSGRPAGGA